MPKEEKPIQYHNNETEHDIAAQVKKLQDLYDKEDLIGPVAPPAHDQLTHDDQDDSSDTSSPKHHSGPPHEKF